MTSTYQKLEQIGTGSFGEVYRGVDEQSGKVVALKLVDLEKADDEIDVIQREIKVMSQISNPHVVQYYTSLMKKSTLWIVMEFMAGGSLKELLDAVGPFPEEAVATVMKALCKGLDYVHKGRKLHRDIKAANILLSDQGDVKLADFGVAGQMTSTVRQRNTFVGSPFWMAPEVIQESLYDEKADIWSMGITGLELANGLPPYASEHPYRALFLIPKNDPPRLEGSQFSKAFKDFTSMCLGKNPTERPSAEQLLSHPFLRKARSSSIRDLLRQKELNSEEGEGKVFIGGDSLASSRNTSVKSPNGSINSGAHTVNSLAKWDFDTLDEIDDITIRSTEEDDQPTANSASQARVVNSQSLRVTPSEKMASPARIYSAREADTLPLGGRGVADSGSSRAHNHADNGESSKSSQESEVLTQLVLPVISQMRADVDASGDHNDLLIQRLGSLEVAFVDAENDKPGIAAHLLECLLKEALVSKSTEIRAMLHRVLPKDHSSWSRG